MPHKHFQQLQMQDVSDLDAQLFSKADAAHGHGEYAGIPVVQDVPAGSTTPIIDHQLNTLDVQVSVYDTSTGAQVGVPTLRLDANRVELTFDQAPTTGQYRVLISSSTGSAATAEGVTGPHAWTHASGGTDRILPSAIGAAALTHTHSQYASSAHNHDGVYQPVGNYAAQNHNHDGVYQPVGNYAAQNHTHNGLIPTGGTTNQALTKSSNSDYDYGWADLPNLGANALKPFPPLNAPTYVKSAGVATPQNRVIIDAALGTHFRFSLALTANGTGNIHDMRVEKPINAVPGQTLIFEVANTAPALPGVLYLLPDEGFSIGDVHAPNMGSRTLDYVVVMFDERGDNNSGQWRVLSWGKGHSLPLT